MEIWDQINWKVLYMYKHGNGRLFQPKMTAIEISAIVDITYFQVRVLKMNGMRKKVTN